MTMYIEDFCCASPQVQFAVPNGTGQLASDQKTAVTLPEGTISAEGIKAISQLLRAEYERLSDTAYYYIAYDLDALGDKFQDTGGNYAKRLSARAAKTQQLKLPAKILEQAGMIAREHSSAPASSVIEVTRKLNEGPGYFYHHDSCWWGSYSYSRCTLKSNGGFGIRSFDGDGNVSGRAWVMPVKVNAQGTSLVPTFNTVSPAAYVVFNGYGYLNGYTAPRLLSVMAGWSYAKVQFNCAQMSVNSGSYVVAPDQGKFSGDVYLRLLHHANLFDTEQAEQAEQAAAVLA